METLEQEWVNGRVTLGAAAKWSPNEIRLVSELGFSLAQQGRNTEAIIIFEGLHALAPSTPYFDSALGALHLRENQLEKALGFLTSAIENNPNDIFSRLNRGEVFFRLDKFDEAVTDLTVVKKNLNSEGLNPLLNQCRTRAKALLLSIKTKNPAE